GFGRRGDCGPAHGCRLLGQRGGSGRGRFLVGQRRGGRGRDRVGRDAAVVEDRLTFGHVLAVVLVARSEVERGDDVAPLRALRDRRVEDRSVVTVVAYEELAGDVN